MLRWAIWLLRVRPGPTGIGLRAKIPDLQARVTHILTRQVFGIGITQLTPTQDWTKKWTGELLYEKYGITNDEITFIEKVVRPMDLSGDDGDD